MTSPRKIALVTGGNAGIGYETCKGLLLAGYHVVLCARSKEKAEDAIAKLLQEDGVDRSLCSAEPLVLDLASLQSTRNAAQTFLSSQRPLHVCVLNAGIMALPWTLTPEDNFEQQWQVNALGHFLLGRLLLPAMAQVSEKEGGSRMIHVASGAHRLHPEPIDYTQLASEHKSDEGFEKWKAYGRSKLANILFSNELARRMESHEKYANITSNALHPGNVQTDLWKKMGNTNNKGISVQDGALTPLYLALSEAVQGQSGGYYFLCEPVTTIYTKEAAKGLSYIEQSKMRTEISMSEEEGKRFWNAASQDVGLSEEI